MPGQDGEGEAGLGRPLERRAGARRKAKRPLVQASRQAVAVTAAAFKQVLMKYIRRQARYGRSFCLAVIEILEYEQVKKVYGAQAAQQLHRLGQDVCAGYMRAADRMCGDYPGRYLLLLPDTQPDEAARALERLVQLMSSAKTHYHHKQLRASCSFKIVDSRQVSSDPEVLLGALGFRIDEQGGLTLETGPSPAYPGDISAQPFWGRFEAWAKRYTELVCVRQERKGTHLKVTRLTALDLWQDGCKPVTVKVIEPSLPGKTFDTSTLELLARRARVLQAIDHPGVVGLIDYHLKDRRKLYLVQQTISGVTLADYASRHYIGRFDVLDWALQICNSIIYLQGLMPPVVPPPPDERSFVVSEQKHLVLVDFEIPYLFPDWYECGQMSGQDILAVAQGRPVAAHTPVLSGFARLMRSLAERVCDPFSDFAALLQRFTAGEVPAEYNTFFKLRAAVKQIWDSERLRTAYRPS